MNEPDALRLINNTPTIQSLLYDLDLMPEQLEAGTMRWRLMLSYASLWVAAIASKPDKYSVIGWLRDGRFIDLPENSLPTDTPVYSRNAEKRG